MWSPAAVTALVAAIGGLITAVTALVHSVKTRQITTAVASRASRAAPPAQGS
jgi:hypothetical protein